MGAAILDSDSNESPSQIVHRISHARALIPAWSWMELKLGKWNVLQAIENVGRRVANGQRVRLLCHCRPWVRCHTEILKQHFEGRYVASSGTGNNLSEPRVGHEHLKTNPWPGDEGFGPK